MTEADQRRTPTTGPATAANQRRTPATGPATAANQRRTPATDLAAPTNMTANQRRPPISDSATPLEETPFMDEWIEGRLSLGISMAQASVRHRHVAYDRTQRRNFLGNINNMQEHGDLGFGLVARYACTPWLALEAANDFRADLDAWNMDDDSCDGTLKLCSWRLEAHLIWSDETWLVHPWAGIGLEDVSASFAHASWWHYGWSSPKDYAQQGGGTEPRNGIIRTMRVEDPGFSPILSFGLTAEVWTNLRVDFFVRWTDCDDVAATFFRSVNGQEKRMRSGAFPAEHVAWGGAVRYEF